MRYFCNALLPTLNVTCNRSSRMSWSTVSKAVLTSKSASNVSSERSIAPYVSDKRRNRRVSVEWNRLNLDWQDGRRLFLSRWQISWYATIFSIIFDRNEYTGSLGSTVFMLSFHSYIWFSANDSINLN